MKYTAVLLGLAATLAAVAAYPPVQNVHDVHGHAGKLYEHPNLDPY